MTRVLSLLAIAGLVGGCASHASVTTAHTVGEGNFQGAIEPGVGSVSTDVAPTFNAAFRYGVSEKVDIGARFGSIVYELTGKYMFTDTEGTVVSIAPAATLFAIGGGGGGAGFFTASTPVLIGIPVGESQFIVGPNWVIYSAIGGGAGVSSGGLTMGPGAHLAYSAKMGEKFRLHPELSLKLPGVINFASAGAGGSSVSAGSTSTGVPIVGFTLGMLFGGD